MVKSTLSFDKLKVIYPDNKYDSIMEW